MRVLLLAANQNCCPMEEEAGTRESLENLWKQPIYLQEENQKK
jgi:hypothetical protein